MAVIDTFRTAAPARRGLLARHWADIVSAVSDWNDARLTRKALSGLTARELDDIGLTRDDIERIAGGR